MLISELLKIRTKPDMGVVIANALNNFASFQGDVTCNDLKTRLENGLKLRWVGPFYRRRLLRILRNNP